MHFLHRNSPFDRFEGLYLAAEKLNGTPDKKPARHQESEAGKRLVHQLAARLLEGDQFEMKRRDSGQPYGVIGRRELGVSIAHSRFLCLAGINFHGNVGVDLEPVDRLPHPGLRQRITSPLDAGCDELETIRLWTIKEAALKWCGTGLRVAMKSVMVKQLEESFFKISIENISALLISLQYQQHWVAVAFDQTQV